MNNGNGHDLSIEDVEDVEVEHPGSRTPTNDAPVVGNGNDDEGVALKKSFYVEFKIVLFEFDNLQG